MGIINKIVSNGLQFAENAKPSFRFSGWQQMGAFTRAADKRTTEQLLTNIDYFAEKLPEVARFKNQLKEMNPKYLGLVSDICEFGNRMEMMPTNINIRKPIANGKSLLEFLMEKLPVASKENPEALNFTQEVINQTDTTASKFFLGAYTPIFEHPETSRHLAATRPLVKDIAQLTLNGRYTMDYSKEQKFVNALNAYINPSVNPEKIEIINETLRTVENLPETIDLTCSVKGSEIINSELSPAQMRENLKLFTQLAENISQKTKEFDLTNFITRNINLD